ncbi:MAG: hypothetical protein Q9222_002067 [Ikaeria aurantiellina]
MTGLDPTSNNSTKGSGGGGAEHSGIVGIEAIPKLALFLVNMGPIKIYAAFYPKDPLAAARIDIA